MSRNSPLRYRLEEVSADELLETTNAQLHGIKDVQLRRRIQEFRQEQILLLTDKATSGKVRHLAQQVLPEGVRSRGTYVQDHLADARLQFQGAPASEVLAAACACIDGSRQQEVLLTLYLEKLRIAASALDTNQLRQLALHTKPNNASSRIAQEVFRERAMRELGEMTTSELHAIAASGGDQWPLDVVKTILGGRPDLPGSAATDDWREQA